MSITRTVLVLDQVTGTLRTDDDEILGHDLDPAARAWVERQRAAGASTEVLLPGSDPLAPATTEPLRSGAAPSEAALPGSGLSGPSPGSDLSAADTTGETLSGEPGVTAFVSADRALRGRARSAGLLPVAHPALLPLLDMDEALVGFRAVAAPEVLLRLAATRPWVPLRYQPAAATGQWAMIALGIPDDVTAAAAQGVSVTPLAYDPAVEDLVLLRLDPSTTAAAAGLGGLRVLWAESSEVLVALGPDDDTATLPVHGAHGHTEALTPDPGLLQAPRTEDVVTGAEAVADDTLAGRVELPSPLLEPVVLDPVVTKRILATRVRCSTVTKGYAERLDRYTGVADLNAAGPVVSRHIAHPDNARVEAQLLADLRAMGYCPWRHQFSYGGRTLSNIIADLPGQGRFRLRAEILRRLRDILTGGGDLRAAVQADDEMRALLDDPDATGLPEPELRRELERIAALEPWNPWWRLRCPPGGWGAGVIVVGAHLDSTAANGPGYRPGVDPAPGRDDNGSGLAAVLTLANHFRRWAGSLTHTVRFCFFNAEEAGLVGSKAYAAQLKAQGAPVRGVYCVDMMGYNSDSSRIFEIHAGYPDPVVRDRSVPLADRIAAAAAAAGTLLPAQIYRGTNNGGGSDRTVFDGAINRSDHAAFQQQGWGGILISEDFFVNLATEPTADANPNYHRASDTSVDVDYAAAITCAIGRAVTLHAL